jgi:KTSC domain-containing protein
MKREPVKSTAIVSVGYERTSHTLEVEFSSGTIYQYHQVDAKTYRQLMKAPSKGRFLDLHIRDEYPFHRVR